MTSDSDPSVNPERCEVAAPPNAKRGDGEREQKEIGVPVGCHTASLDGRSPSKYANFPPTSSFSSLSSFSSFSSSSSSSLSLSLSSPAEMLHSGVQVSKQTQQQQQHKRIRSLPHCESTPPRPNHQKLRVYHDDQPYLALPTPVVSPKGIKSLLPCPPASPSGSGSGNKHLRFSFGRHRTPRSVHPPLLVRQLQVLKDLAAASWQWVPARLHFSSNSPAGLWVALYFFLNLSLTLYNKYVLMRFPFPYTLTALHGLCGTVGTFLMIHLKMTPDPPIPTLTFKETLVLLLFSLLYTVNILVSNASLKLVTVPFHQVVRGSAPLFTIALSALLFRKGCSRMKLLSLLPVIVGVGFATYGDYYYTLFGFLLTLLGTLLASIKTIVTNIFLRSPETSSAPSVTTPSPNPKPGSHPGLPNRPHHPHHPHHRNASSLFTFLRESDSQHRLTTARSRFTLPKLSLTPLQLLYFMSPLAFIQTTVLAQLTGELGRVRAHMALVPSSSSSGPMHALDGSHVSHGGGLGFGLGLGFGGWGGLGLGAPSWWLVLNGVMAFALNVVSFNSNKRIGPLGMSVAANVKQVLTILCAVGLFDLTITFTNGIGIALTLVGGAWYAYLEMREKQKIRRSG